MFTNNGYCQLLMFCCHCLPCISPFHKILRFQFLVPSPYLPAFVGVDLSAVVVGWKYKPCALCCRGLSALCAAPCCMPAAMQRLPLAGLQSAGGRRVNQQSSPLPRQLSHRYWHSSSLKQSGRVRRGRCPRSQEHQMFSSFSVINRIASTQPTSTELSRYNVGWVWVGGEGSDTQYGIH